MPIKAVVFDIGGILEYTPPTGWITAWEERLGLPAGNIDEQLMDVWRAGSVGSMTEADVIEQIRTRLGLDNAQLAAFLDDLWAEYLGTPNTELIAYFRSLRPRLRTALLSNSFVGARAREQERYQYAELCECIIYSHEVGLSKPDPRIYALTCERLGLAPHEIIFLDDREQCIEGACAAGMHGIVFHDNAQAIAEIEACIAAQASS